MAVVGNLHKIVFGGKLADTEEWSCSLHFLSPDSININSDLLNSAISQWFARGTSNLNIFATLDYNKVNQINPLTGKYVNAAMPKTWYYVPAVAVAAGSAAGSPQLTIAVSTFTALLRGRASKGRFFPPTSLNTFTAGGKLAVSKCLDMSTSASQLITDLNGAASGSCVVFSKIGQSTAEILGCQVGDITDTQQRRRRNLKEVYQRTFVS